MAEPVTLQTLLTYLTLISVPVGVFYHIMTLRNTRKNQDMQLETRQAQLFMNFYLHMATDEAQKADYDLIRIDFKNVEDWNAILEDKDKFSSFFKRATYFEGLGLLVRKKFLDIDMVAGLYSGAIMSWWEKYEAGTKAIREHYGWPRAMIEAEFLYDSVIEYARDHPELKIASPIFYQSKPES